MIFAGNFAHAAVRTGEILNLQMSAAAASPDTPGHTTQAGSVSA